ncbi:MAG TPA: BatA domain-containing protein, partial [Humisphaera sp.]
MSWLTSFQLLSWKYGAIAAGIVIPSLLLLYFLKLRRREVAVASTLLWRRAVQDLQVNSPFQRLRKNLLLLIQLIVLLLLLLALSRPVFSWVPPPGRYTVIVIDRSGSMSARDMPNG